MEDDEKSYSSKASTPLKSFVSMSSMLSEHNAGELDMQTRVFSLNFPSVFTYVHHQNH